MADLRRMTFISFPVKRVHATHLLLSCTLALDMIFEPHLPQIKVMTKIPVTFNIPASKL